MKEINRKIARGAAWMVLFKLIQRSLSLVSVVILARLLMPEDFGLIAIAMAIIAGLELMGAFSFDVTLIQNQEAERRHYDTAWTFNVLFAVVSALVLLMLASPAAAFYDEPRLEAVMYVLAVGSLIQGFENIGVVAFRKEMQFNKEFNFLLLKKLASFATTVPLAFMLGNYWALVAGMLVGNFIGVVLSYMLHPYRPRFSLAARHELFHFSKWLLFNNILGYLRISSADFIIGKMVNAHALGLYTIAYEISNSPTTELIAPINRAVFPGYAKMSNDPAELRQGFLNVISVIVLFALPMGAGIAVTADPLVQVFLGPNWQEAVPLIQILAIFGVITAMQTNTGYVYLALGEPKIITFLQCLYLSLLIPLLLWSTAEAGAVGAAWAYLVTAMVLFPVYYVVLSRKLSIGAIQLFSVLWRPLLATTVMLIAVKASLFLTLPMPGFLGTMLQLVIAVITGILTYGIGIVAMLRVSSNPTAAETYIMQKLDLLVKWRMPS